METPRNSSPGFSGPRVPGLDEEVVRLRRQPFRARSIRLPGATRGTLARTAATIRRSASSVPAAGDAPTARALVAGVSALERTLLQRTTLGPTGADYQRIAAIGYDGWLDEQLDYESLDNAELEDTLHAELPTLSMSATTLYETYLQVPFVPVLELWLATVYRALYSPRQLYERMVVFWTDHFNIDIFVQPQPLLKPIDDREVVRRHALGHLADLLSGSAHSPAMLAYLTNDTNVKGQPNENYARELMELHTMGADTGYDEDDVKEVARCFTGWTWSAGFRGIGAAGTFQFRSSGHDNGAKVVLGQAIPAGGGIGDGERVLEILAGRKETREFIAAKMLRWVWGYEPKNNSIKKVADAYKRNDGDIREMLRVALSSKRLESATTKMKRPFHMATSALRAMAAELSDGRFVLEGLRETGHIPFDWSPPDGYPDRIDYWSGFILPRWNFAAEIFSERGLSWDPALDDPSGTVASIIDRLDDTFLGGTMTPATRDQLEAYLAAGTLDRDRVRTTIGLTLASPEFQEY